MPDEIMQKRWAAKEAIVKEADCDLDKLCQLLKEWQVKNRAESAESRSAQDTPETRSVKWITAPAWR